MSGLTKLQSEVLKVLASSPLRERFYLTGGTLLAARYLHHRLSQDLDFFSREPFAHQELLGFINELKKHTQLTDIEEKKIFDRWEFFLHNEDNVRLEFVRYNYPALGPREIWQGVLVDSLDDIAANKTLALIDRNEPKDAFDLYCILTKAEYTIARLLELVEKKFSIYLEEGLVWSEALKSAGELETLSPLIEDQDKNGGVNLLRDIEAYFEDRSREFLRGKLEE